MKILQVIHIFNPKSGGPVSQVSSISQKLVEKGHDVTILTTDYLFDQSYAKQLKNVEIIPFKCIFNIGPFVYSPDIHSWLSERINDFDIIHMHSYRSYQNAVIRAYAKKNNVPYILQARGSVLPFFEKQLLKKCFDAVWGKKILRDASVCIALTETESKQYRQMGVPENKIVIIPNGIDISQYDDLPPRGRFRLKNKIPENEQMILSLGRIHKIKGIDLLLDAFSRLCHEMGNVKLIIAGPDGGDLARIKTIVTEFNLDEKVIFIGPLYGIDKLEAYCDADIFILPSRYEVFGNTVLESLACGTPVIATKGCHIAENLQETGTGVVVGYNPVELKYAIVALLQNITLAQNMGEKGRELVFSQFNQETIVTHVESLYRDCISINKTLK